MVRVRPCLLLVLVLGASLFVNPVRAQTTASPQQCAAWVARLVSWQGSLVVRRPGVAGVQPASLRQNFCVGDVLEVGAYSRAALELPDQTVVSVDQGTVITFAAPADDKRTWLDILKGAIHVISRDPRALRVITPFANAGIEGTEFFVGVGGDATTVIVYEGSVKVENSAGVATAAAGESVLARAGSAPVLQQVVRPRDAVVWTLYYPPTASGPLPDAAAAEPAVPSVDFFVGRAEQRLRVGRMAEADADLASALSLAPGSAEVLARQSVIALTRNQTETAAGLADEAVTAAPDSAAARLARSYTRQAALDLPGAISDLEAGAAAHPDNALLRARLAELWLASGEIARSEAEAKAALAADPQLGLAHSVLGFVYLSRIQLVAAKDSFLEAIRLEPSAPLPRLGLGLGQIRSGDLQAGRAEIERAVISDPGNSLLRSYMGKAYYAEKQDKLSASQLALARELDPRDPTPWFYDAIRRQTVNDPIGAASDLERSVDLNDDRAVYRSRLLLDQDLAARSASLGRVYRSLGYEELGLREGWKSIATDPADYSGHRLLADSYSILPRHEIARVNELLQSQLLQPLNTSAVQPQLGEANLFILDSSGPSSMGFNEFNPLFASNGLYGQVSAVAGGNSTQGGDAVLAGIHDRWSFSLGGYTYETDGFRPNNDLDVTTGNLLIQYQLSPDTSFLAEARTSTQDRGELRLRFDSDAFDSSLPREDEDTTSLRFGVRHDFSPRSTLLALLSYQSRDYDFTLTAPPLDSNLDTRTYSGELQYIYRADAWSVVSGLRYFESTVEDTFDFMGDVSVDTRRPESLSAYVYGTAEILPQLQLTLGISRDENRNVVYDRSRWNPKAGLIWQATDNTTIRAGAFRTLQLTTPARQEILPSLEPTAVAGFNQFFFGSQSEEADRYGVGIDHRFSGSLHGGAELSRRRLDVPYMTFIVFPPEVRTADVREDSARAYLYWSATDRLAASLAYVYDQARNDTGYTPNFVQNVETHQVALQLGWFDPRGPLAVLRPVYGHQRGRFQDTSAPPFPFVSDSDDFTIVDALVGYRLPRRRGLISFEIRNLFDSDFNFQDIDPDNPRIYPERVALLKATLAY